MTRVHLTAGGSEGVETLVKIALEYHAACGRERKTKIIARTPSYHGTTLGTLAVSGHASRRFGLDHALPAMPDVPAPYALRCPDPDVGGFCLRALKEKIHREDPETVAGILAEPIVGASGGALVPPDGYWQAVRALCDEHDILLLADEVMCGFGRTGTRFALDRWGVEPDVMVAGKGLGGGYAPITGVYGTESVAEGTPTGRHERDVPHLRSPSRSLRRRPTRSSRSWTGSAWSNVPRTRERRSRPNWPRHWLTTPMSPKCAAPGS